MSDFALQLAGSVTGALVATLILITALRRLLPGGRAPTNRAVDAVVSVVVMVVLMTVVEWLVDGPPFVNGFLVGVSIGVGLNCYGIVSAVRTRRTRTGLASTEPKTDS